MWHLIPDNLSLCLTSFIFSSTHTQRPRRKQMLVWLCQRLNLVLAPDNRNVSSQSWMWKLSPSSPLNLDSPSLPFSASRSLSLFLSPSDAHLKSFSRCIMSLENHTNQPFVKAHKCNVCVQSDTSLALSPFRKTAPPPPLPPPPQKATNTTPTVSFNLFSRW